MQTIMEFPRRRWVPDLSVLTGEEARIVRALDYGRERAKQVRRIAEESRIPQRQVQAMVERLVLSGRAKIGSAMGAPAGNYLIDSLDDLEATCALLRSRWLAGMLREAALRDLTHQRLLEEIQPEIELEEVA